MDCSGIIAYQFSSVMGFPQDILYRHRRLLDFLELKLKVFELRGLIHPTSGDSYAWTTKGR